MCYFHITFLFGPEELLQMGYKIVIVFSNGNHIVSYKQLVINEWMWKKKVLNVTMLLLHLPIYYYITFLRTNLSIIMYYMYYISYNII